jgi:hypothetical protein
MSIVSGDAHAAGASAGEAVVTGDAHAAGVSTGVSGDEHAAITDGEASADSGASQPHTIEACRQNIEMAIVELSAHLQSWLQNSQRLGVSSSVDQALAGILTAIGSITQNLNSYITLCFRVDLVDCNHSSLIASYQYTALIVERVAGMVNTIQTQVVGGTYNQQSGALSNNIVKLDQSISRLRKIPSSFMDQQYKWLAALKASKELPEDRANREAHKRLLEMTNLENEHQRELEVINSREHITDNQNKLAAMATIKQTELRMAAVNKNLQLLLAGGSLATVGVLAAYFIFRKYAQTKPKIIEDGDTSIGTLFKKAKFPEPRLDSLVLTPELEHLVRSKFEALEVAILNKLPLSNMMFYGPPGTGKTMAAQEFMRYLSRLGIADHIIIRGPAFRRFSSTSEAIEALASTIRFARHSYRKRKRPCFIFFDEADVLFADRLNPAISTDLSRNAVVTLTSLVPAAIGKDLVFIFSANNKKDFDIAIFDRVDQSNQVYFPLPGQKEREALLRLYLNEHFVKNGFAIAPDFDQSLGALSQKLEGLSGRQISSTVVQALYPLLNKGDGERELTVPVFENVICDRVFSAGQLMGVKR